MISRLRQVLLRLRSSLSGKAERARKDRDAATQDSQKEAYAAGEAHAFGIAESEVRDADEAEGDAAARDEIDRVADNACTVEIWGLPHGDHARIERLIRELKAYKNVDELGPSKWSVSYSDGEDRDAAEQKLRTVLGEIEKDWQFLVTIA